MFLHRDKHLARGCVIDEHSYGDVSIERDRV